MKKLIIPLLALLALCACQKVNLSDDEIEEEQSNLTVRVFQIEQTSFEGFTRAEGDAPCTRLNFVIYDEDGVRVAYKNQQLSDNGFGTASFQLGEGTYHLVVVAHSSNGNPKTTDMGKIQFTNAQGFTDTFLYYGTITIEDEPVEENVTLNRIVSLCRFVITDDYPDDVARMRFYYTGGSGAFDAKTGFGSVNSQQSLFFDVDENQKQFDLYTFLHATTGTIKLTVTALDDDDNVLYERTFEVPLEQNKITWYTGSFFTGSSAAGTTTMTVTINTDWAGEKQITFDE